MPIYEYRCPRGHTFELFQRMTDPPPEACQVCGEAPVTKVLYPAAIHFKGSGFYSTDYGRGSRRGAQKESGDDGGDGGEKKADKADKTEPKAAEPS
ncbi:MAG TPA: zinc ribbon domain-containing protein [Gaiellaceae bacterium]|nr:zinc ribbon domain-containing protein [Gaiellaceae bacterium]